MPAKIGICEAPKRTVIAMIVTKLKIPKGKHPARANKEHAILITKHTLIA
jgi:hypothetical protein